MSRFRRALLFCPLVLLTLFFTACGWRNWQLGRDEKGVWLASALYGARQLPASDLWTWRISPQSATTIERTLNEEHPGLDVHIFSVQKKEIDTGRLLPPNYIVMGPLQFQNLFHATTSVIVSESASKHSSRHTTMHELTLNRSPLALWGDGWRITSTRVLHLE